jgi:hypothetical protein
MVDFGCETLSPPGWLGRGVPVFFLAGDPPSPHPVSWGGGCMYFFLAGAPPTPLLPFGWRVYPPPRYPRRYPPPVLRMRFHVGEHIFRMVYFGCGTLPPPGWLGWGVPVFFFCRGTPHPPPAIWLEGIPPSKVPKVAPPPRFPARVYVGDTIQFIAQKGDREGGPPLC